MQEHKFNYTLINKGRCIDWFVNRFERMPWPLESSSASREAHCGLKWIFASSMFFNCTCFAFPVSQRRTRRENQWQLIFGYHVCTPRRLVTARSRGATAEFVEVATCSPFDVACSLWAVRFQRPQHSSALSLNKLVNGREAPSRHVLCADYQLCFFFGVFFKTFGRRRPN